MQVKIGSSYFSKEKNDYTNWVWAFVREAMQNCIDAPRSNKITASCQHDTTQDLSYITFANNGQPMDRETLENKLLTLGESGKNFEGSVGGFGKAKVILYFCHLSYTIHTGNLLVEGSGGNYTITETDYYPGTKSTVVMEGDCDSVIANFKKFASLCQWNGTFTLDGNELPCSLKKGYYHKTINIGRLYTNKNLSGAVVFRINGIPMFSQWSKHGIIVEIEGKSGDFLSSNRDSIKYQFTTEFEQFKAELATDGKKALRAKTRKVSKWGGYKNSVSSQNRLKYLVKDNAPLDPVSLAYTTQAQSNSGSVDAFLNPSNWPNLQKALPKATPEFFIINDTELEIPNIYTPDNFSSYSLRLMTAWKNCLVTIHEIMDRPIVFSIGFIFSIDSLAEYRRCNGDIVYSINPCKIIQDDKGTRIKNRYTIVKDKYDIIAAAVHEYTHIDYGSHDADFAAALTANTAVIMKEIKRFHKCFKV